MSLSLQRSLAEATLSRRQVMAQYLQCQTELREARAQVEALTRERSRRWAAVSALEEASKRTADLLDSEAETSARMATLTATLEKEKAKTRSHQAAFAKLEAANKALAADLEASKRGEERAARDMADLRRQWRAAVTDAEEECQRLRRHSHAVEADNGALREECSHLKAKLLAAVTRHEADTDARVRAAVLAAESKQADAEAVAQNVVALSGKLRDRVDTLDTACRRLQLELDASAKRHGKSKAKAAAACEELARTREELRQARANFARERAGYAAAAKAAGAISASTATRSAAAAARDTRPASQYDALRRELAATKAELDDVTQRYRTQLAHSVPSASPPRRPSFSSRHDSMSGGPTVPDLRPARAVSPAPRGEPTPSPQARDLHRGPVSEGIASRPAQDGNSFGQWKLQLGDPTPPTPAALRTPQWHRLDAATPSPRGREPASHDGVSRRPPYVSGGVDAPQPPQLPAPTQPLSLSQQQAPHTP